VRMMKNKFYDEIKKAREEHAGIDQLQELLGKSRARRGMFEGNLQDGELEIGEVSALINDIKPAEKIIRDIWLQFNEALNKPLK